MVISHNNNTDIGYKNGLKVSYLCIASLVVLYVLRQNGKIRQIQNAQEADELLKNLWLHYFSFAHTSSFLQCKVIFFSTIPFSNIDAYEKFLKNLYLLNISGSKPTLLLWFIWDILFCCSLAVMPFHIKSIEAKL